MSAPRIGAKYPSTALHVNNERCTLAINAAHQCHAPALCASAAYNHRAPALRINLAQRLLMLILVVLPVHYQVHIPKPKPNYQLTTIMTKLRDLTHVLIMYSLFAK